MHCFSMLSISRRAAWKLRPLAVRDRAKLWQNLRGCHPICSQRLVLDLGTFWINSIPACGHGAIPKRLHIFGRNWESLVLQRAQTQKGHWDCRPAQELQQSLPTALRSGPLCCESEAVAIEGKCAAVPLLNPLSCDSPQESRPQ